MGTNNAVARIIAAAQAGRAIRTQSEEEKLRQAQIQQVIDQLAQNAKLYPLQVEQAQTGVEAGKLGLQETLANVLSKTLGGGDLPASAGLPMTHIPGMAEQKAMDVEQAGRLAQATTTGQLTAQLDFAGKLDQKLIESAKAKLAAVGVKEDSPLFRPLLSKALGVPETVPYSAVAKIIGVRPPPELADTQIDLKDAVSEIGKFRQAQVTTAGRTTVALIGQGYGVGGGTATTGTGEAPTEGGGDVIDTYVDAIKNGQMTVQDFRGKPGLAARIMQRANARGVQLPESPQAMQQKGKQAGLAAVNTSVTNLRSALNNADFSAANRAGMGTALATENSVVRAGALASLGPNERQVENQVRLLREDVFTLRTFLGNSPVRSDKQVAILVGIVPNAADVIAGRNVALQRLANFEQVFNSIKKAFNPQGPPYIDVSKLPPDVAKKVGLVGGASPSATTVPSTTNREFDYDPATGQLVPRK